MRYLALFLLLLSAAAGAGAPAVAIYPECEGFEGAKLEVCQSEVFSRRRLRMGTEENEYAIQAETENSKFAPSVEWYNAPNADRDGRAGGSLVTCGAQQNQCLSGCKGNGACTQKCYDTMVTCAGTGSIGGSSLSQTEAPDGYVIEFDDQATKNPQ
jgi:hypothetical protein